MLQPGELPAELVDTRCPYWYEIFRKIRPPGARNWRAPSRTSRRKKTVVAVAGWRIGEDEVCAAPQELQARRPGSLVGT